MKLLLNRCFYNHGKIHIASVELTKLTALNVWQNRVPARFLVDRGFEADRGNTRRMIDTFNRVNTRKIDISSGSLETRFSIII